MFLDNVYNLTVDPSPFAPGGPIAAYFKGNFFVRLQPLNALSKYEAMSLVMHEVDWLIIKPYNCLCMSISHNYSQTLYLTGFRNI